MRISSIEARCYRVPANVPLRPNGTYEFMLVRVETSDGTVGFGPCGRPMMESTATFINKDVAPFLSGKDPLRTERIWQEMLEKFNIRVLSGVWSSAMSAVDIALWDIKGKAFGVPVAVLLGGARDQVPVYMTFGLPSYTREELAEVATMMVDAGYNRLKMRVADDRDLDEDAARIEAVRHAVGDKVDLMIDANCRLTITEALSLCRMIEPLQISWFEEPVRGNDFRLLSELRQKTDIPITAGQNLGHSWQHRELIVSGAVDYSQPNVCSVGGYSEGYKVANLARAFNIPISNGGGWADHNLHLQAGVSNGSYIEYHLSTMEATRTFFAGVPEMQDGYVHIPSTPGLGFEPRPDMMDSCQI